MAVRAQIRNCAAVKTLLLACVAIAALSACAGLRPPGWQTDTQANLERYRLHYLDGDSARAQRDFRIAMTQLGSTGRLDLAARAELLRCALATASLNFDACAGFSSRQADANDEDRAYGHFINGQWSQVDPALLPARYRRVFDARDEAAQNAAAATIDDPLSRLVAVGTLFRMGRVSATGLDAAIAAASAQGYRRPLLALLTVQAKRAEAADDVAALELIRRRIILLQGATVSD